MDITRPTFGWHEGAKMVREQASCSIRWHDDKRNKCVSHPLWPYSHYYARLENIVFIPDSALSTLGLVQLFRLR